MLEIGKEKINEEIVKYKFYEENKTLGEFGAYQTKLVVNHLLAQRLLHIVQYPEQHRGTIIRVERHNIDLDQKLLQYVVEDVLSAALILDNPNDGIKGVVRVEQQDGKTINISYLPDDNKFFMDLEYSIENSLLNNEGIITLTVNQHGDNKNGFKLSGIRQSYSTNEDFKNNIMCGFGINYFAKNLTDKFIDREMYLVLKSTRYKGVEYRKEQYRNRLYISNRKIEKQCDYDYSRGENPYMQISKSEFDERLRIAEKSTYTMQLVRLPYELVNGYFNISRENIKEYLGRK